MKKSIWSISLTFMFLVILLSGCTPSATLVPATLTFTPIPPTATPVLTATPVPTATPIPPTATPISKPIGEVETQQGIVILTSVERAMAWPQGCDPNANFGTAKNCFIVANDGYEILIVNFMSKDSTVEKIDVELDANIYVSGEDSQQYDLGSAGFSGDAQMVMFSVPIDTKGLTLHWENNPPIALPD